MAMQMRDYSSKKKIFMTMMQLQVQWLFLYEVVRRLKRLLTRIGFSEKIAN